MKISHIIFVGIAMVILGDTFSNDAPP